METSVYDFNRITGSNHKRIGIDEVVQDALNNGINTISVISSGNYRDAILAEIKRRHVGNQLRLVNLVNRPRDMPETELGTRGAILKNSKERERYVTENIPEAGKVRDYTDFISRELRREAELLLRQNPDYVALGVGSGKLFVTLYRRIKEMKLGTTLVGILPKGENPIFEEGNFRFRSSADKLVAPYSSFKDEVLQAQSEGHVLYEATDRELRRANKVARRQGVNAEVSGSAGFVLYDPRIMAQCGIDKDSRVVMVNTGRGEQKIIEMPVYMQILKPVLAAAASIAILAGANFGVEQYRTHETVRLGLTYAANMTAKTLGDNPNFNKMSNSELNEYLRSCKTRMGGPPQFYL